MRRRRRRLRISDERRDAFAFFLKRGDEGNTQPIGSWLRVFSF